MTFYNSSSTMRPKTLMEMLLAKKIEAASAEGGAPSSRRLFRTDSMDSVSSIGSCGSCTSSMFGSDVCRCDDCLLGIVDLYVNGPKERAFLKKKVISIHSNSNYNIIPILYSIYTLFELNLQNCYLICQ